MLRALCLLGVRKAWAPRAAPCHCEAIRDPFPDRVSIYATAQHLTLADSASPGSYIVPVFAYPPQRRCVTQTPLRAHRPDAHRTGGSSHVNALCVLSSSVHSSPLGILSPSLLTNRMSYILLVFQFYFYSHTFDSI